MNTVNTEVMNEVMAVIAKHYADKISASGMEPTESAVQEAVAENWDKVSKQIAELYGKAMNLLENK